MAGEKLYYVQYTGSDVIAVPKAGKFMPGTGIYLPEAEARELSARGDFMVHGLDEAPELAPPTAAPPEPEPVAETKPEPEPEKPKEKPVEAPPHKSRKKGAEAQKPAPELAKTSVPWHSDRTKCDTRLVRWGHLGTPVLLLPPEGGEAEDIEKTDVIGALRPLLDAGRIKVYSCDSFASRALLSKEGTPQHRMWLLNVFHQYIAEEVVPAIRNDCQSDALTAIAAGAGLGAFHAAALVSRYPDRFDRALCVSGTFQLERLLEESELTDDFIAASPLQFLPKIEAGPHLDLLRTRSFQLFSGEEEMEESQSLALALEDKGIPNRVDVLDPKQGGNGSAWRQILSKLLSAEAASAG